MQSKMLVNGLEVSTRYKDDVTYISLTDIAKLKNSENPADVVIKWMSNKDSFDFYCLWEELFNENFNLAESREIKHKEVGYNAFTMSPTQWKKRTNAIGIVPSAGKYSVGTFAHPDIAMEFASWIDTPFKLYLIREFQRLKSAEFKQLEWNARREIAKLNYKIHTQAIKDEIVPNLKPSQVEFAYANEADRLNVALFGQTSGEWKTANPKLDGNIRDYASIHQLLVMTNLESYNSAMIKEGVDDRERLIKLNNMARYQLPILIQSNNLVLKEAK